MAAFLARDRWDGPDAWERGASGGEEGQDVQVVMQASPPSPLNTSTPNLVPEFQEWRGVSYAIGADHGALTFPNILAHYTNSTGSSTGHHPTVCIGAESGGCHPRSDGMNGAVSGSIAASLVGQVTGGSKTASEPATQPNARPPRAPVRESLGRLQEGMDVCQSCHWGQ